MGNYQLAIKDFNKSIEIDEKLAEGYYFRGLCLLASKNFHQAIEDLLKSRDIVLEDTEDADQMSAGIQDGLGQCYHALKNYDFAIRYYDNAIEKDEKNTEFLMHRAQCYYDQDMFDKSIEDLQYGLSILQNDP